jgi:hypothetical protein
LRTHKAPPTSRVRATLIGANVFGHDIMGEKDKVFATSSSPPSSSKLMQLQAFIVELKTTEEPKEHGNFRFNNFFLNICARRSRFAIQMRSEALLENSRHESASAAGRNFSFASCTSCARSGSNFYFNLLTFRS